MKNKFPDLNTVSKWEDAVNEADCLVIMTEWNEFRGMDLQKIKDLMKSPKVLDCRNILSIDDLESLGFEYDNVGRKKK